MIRACQQNIVKDGKIKMVTTTKNPAKTNLGRKLAEYQSKAKLDNSQDNLDFIEKLKASDAKLFGFKNLEEYQAELDKLEANKVHAGKRELDTAFQTEFSVKSDNYERACADVDADAETYKKNVITARTELINFADSYKQTVGIGESSKRTDFRRMRIQSVGGGSIRNYFGGWGDGSKELRHQYACGRLSADANSNLDGDLVTDDMRKIVNKVIKLSSPYNNGQTVPQGKSSGYELKPPEPQDNKADTTATDKTTTKKQGDKKRNHHKKH